VAADAVVDLVAQDGRHQSSAIASGRLISPAPHSVPTTNSSESPGRKGITTTPVSTKMMRNSSA
jgi:hypothetical protein